MKKVFTISVLFFCIQYVNAQTWNTIGNAGTTPGTNFIGTTDNKDFVFKTNNTEKGRVKSNGLWQFGVTGNLAKFDSAGNLSFAGNAVYKVAGNKYAFQYSGNANYGLFFNSTNLRYEFRDVNASPVAYFNANGTGGAYIKGSTGIGTVTPVGKLNVKGNSNVPQLVVDANSTQSNTNPLIKLRNNNGQDLMWIHSDDTSDCFVGVNAGRLNNVVGFGTDNTFIGGNSGRSNTTGFWNTATGSHSLSSNTEGNFNTADGVEALYSNTTGYQNTAIGVRALYSNDIGGNNTATGFHTMYQNTTGVNNVAYGNDALFSNSDGYSNSAMGFSCLTYNSTGHDNTAVGTNALRANTSGLYNTAVGSSALNLTTTGSYNTAIGYKALYATNPIGYGNTAVGALTLEHNTDGHHNTGCGTAVMNSNTTGIYNTAVGNGALYYNVSGNYNCSYGTYSVYNNDVGSFNVGIGYQSLFFTYGNNNTGIGYKSLENNQGGSNNTALGYLAGSNGSPTNLTAVGYNAGHVNSLSNSVEIGNTTVGWIGGQVGWSNYSDKRIKDNIQSNVPGLLFINKLNPVTYHLNIHRENEICGIKDSVEWDGKYDLEKIIQTGFIAQEVEQAAKECKFDFNGVTPPHDDSKLYSLQYASFVVPLVKAVQELDSMNIDLKTSNDELKNEIAQLKQQMNQFDQSLSQCCNSYQSAGGSQGATDIPKLNQNVPNPFSLNTVIKYYLPQSAKNGVIKIYSIYGTELKSFSLNQTGFGEVLVSGGSLSSGVYVYTLLIDGNSFDTKQMILTKN